MDKLRKNKLFERNLKSNKGFTMQDVAIAVVILILFAGIVGSIYISIYKVQAETQIDAVVTLYMIQIAEYIDKVSYDEVENGMEQTLRNQFQVPSPYQFTVDVTNYQPTEDNNDLIKEIIITFNYSYAGKEKTMVFEKLKIKEL